MDVVERFVRSLTVWWDGADISGVIQCQWRIFVNFRCTALNFDEEDDGFHDSMLRVEN